MKKQLQDLDRYHVIGIMSGTSLDGLDIAHCTFKLKNGKWTYAINQAATIKYPATWLEKLASAHQLTGEALISLDSAYGKYVGLMVLAFLQKHKLKTDFIASHGHTIFHQPSGKANQAGFTYQLGNGNAIHAACKLPVVYDFRSLDVAHGGQGAPLVPAGDKFLFSDYGVCLNLGGIANLSRDIKKERIAYDICFCNMGLNYLSQKIGKDYDKDGALAEAGEINKAMLAQLNKVYKSLEKKRPSLGREIFEKQIQPLLDDENISLHDRLRTFTESASLEISKAIVAQGNTPQVLCTGGGAFNSFLISRILDHCGDAAMLIIPEGDVIKFKEALVFAYLGVLRVRGEVNCLKSVTGASQDSSGGLLIG